jgi:hypothetical protein
MIKVVNISAWARMSERSRKRANATDPNQQVALQWPHRVPHAHAFRDDGSVVNDWLEENFGPCGSQVWQDADSDRMLNIETDSAWGKVGGGFHFRDPDHAFAFKMRWG